VLPQAAVSQTVLSQAVPSPASSPPFSGVPGAGFVVPEALRRRLPDGIESVVWLNEAGGVTVRGLLGGERVYAKWAPASAAAELDLAAEAERLRWAAPYLPVPEVLGFAAHDDGQLLVTRALPGSNAVTPRWRSEPEQAVRALGAGLRRLHESLPVDGCPFSWSVDDRVARGRAQGLPSRVTSLDALGPAPAIDRLVVCHGDACAPNTLLGDTFADAATATDTDAAAVTGYVDLGRLGVADRWADIAVGAWSTEWNYGAGYTDLYYASYGVEPDRQRIAYYRALWDAT
jgi:kanamycin kinase